ncbi:NAD(P)H:quinone oxidoreductase [Alkalicoccobacillus porphyridii]|uniref:NAD(P)H:quinone oxidoreductase n=1 Tax=Alkalicoccobacillus porphyridii TaxID=2597270 RepID=A0A553ZVJ4_9BACI|nr:NAD(P)H:quinone oxidoreductase [Alkalicoccobacillus porphyridii]TSB45508.1 NAD(P)H:quinone oxidoreductase [Alkalicoccobacillus porphyridii]
MVKIVIPYYSSYGHVYSLAKAVEEGANKVDGAEVKLVKIPETKEVREAMSSQDAYVDAQKQQEDLPDAVHEDLIWADGIIWGFPTRYGNMPAQVKQFLDAAGGLWANGSLEGRATSIFTSTASVHGGQESTILTSLVPLLHFGLIYVGLPYGENPEQLTTEGIGGSPYGASTIAGSDGSRQPDERELVMASRLGERVTKVAAKLAAES